MTAVQTIAGVAGLGQAPWPVVWACVGGAVLHWFLKASAVAATPAAPLVPTRRAWLRRNWRALVVRSALSAALFTAWCFDPAWAKDWLGFPLNPGTAFLYGYLVDGALYLAAAKFRILDGQIPGYTEAV